MATNTYFDESVVIGVNDAPTVSIIEPFHPMMSAKAELQYRFKLVTEKVEKELMQKFPGDKALLVILKLHHLLRNLNYNTHKKSIAIFVSPMIERVYYLDIPVEERVVIDDSFEIRDLIYSKKQNIRYLVLLLSAERSKMYLGNCQKFTLIKSNVPENIFAYKNEIPERVGNFSDPDKRKEILLDKFLQHMDQGLSLILNAYDLPVFVMGPKRVLGHFKKITGNAEKLVEFIYGNYDGASEYEIRSALRPYINEWRKIKQQAILQELDKAMSEHRLAVGIHEVWKYASQKNCRLLVVEKDFIYPTPSDKNESIKSIKNSAFYIKDVVDDLIEKVLQSGGDVEFVEKDVIKNYERIALIRFY